MLRFGRSLMHAYCIDVEQIISRNLHLDFGHFDSNIRVDDVGGPAITSRIVDI